MKIKIDGKAASLKVHSTTDTIVGLLSELPMGDLLTGPAIATKVGTKFISIRPYLAQLKHLRVKYGRSFAYGSPKTIAELQKGTH